MQFLNHNFFILVLFEHRISIPLKRLYILQKRSLWLVYFLNRNAHTTPYFKDWNKLKFPDKIALENCIFIKNYFNQTLPTSFKHWFTLSTDSHTHNRRSSKLGCLKSPLLNTKIYGRQSVNDSAIYTWNYLQIHHKNAMFHPLFINQTEKANHAIFPLWIWLTFFYHVCTFFFIC